MGTFQVTGYGAIDDILQSVLSGRLFIGGWRDTEAFVECILFDLVNKGILNTDSQLVQLSFPARRPPMEMGRVSQNIRNRCSPRRDHGEITIFVRPP